MSIASMIVGLLDPGIAPGIGGSSGSVSQSSYLYKRTAAKAMLTKRSAKPTDHNIIKAVESPQQTSSFFDFDSPLELFEPCKWI